MHISDTSTRTRTAFALHAVCAPCLSSPACRPRPRAPSTRWRKAEWFQLGYRDNSLPFSYLNADKRPIGYSIDICLKIVDALKREIKRNDLNVKYVKVTTETRLKSLESGEIDLECGSTNASAERRKLADFTIPTYIASTRLLVKSDSGIKSVYDLAGKTVVMTKGTTQEKLFAEINKNHTLRAKTVLGNTRTTNRSPCSRLGRPTPSCSTTSCSPRCAARPP